jgi:hypothetical protein
MFCEGVCPTLFIFECLGVTMSYERKVLGETSGYVSYLLRLWREKGSASTGWRASLQDPLSGERVGFAHLDELVAFLREKTRPTPPVEGLEKDKRAPKTSFTSEEGGLE